MEVAIADKYKNGHQHRIELIAGKSLIYESLRGLSICDLFTNFSD